MAKLEDINAKLDYIEVTKQLIKQAIENKGQDIEDTDTFREFVNKISNIKTKTNFVANGPAVSDGSYVIGDTIELTYPKDFFALGDYCYIRFDKSKQIAESHSVGYTYKYGILEVIGIEPINESRDNVTSKVIFIFNEPYPEFISRDVNETGIKYGNSITNTRFWYSYDYSGLDVQAENVLEDKKFQGPSGIETGTMTNNGQLNFTPTSSQQIIPAGYTSGGVISAMDITISNDYNRCLALSKEILGIE